MRELWDLKIQEADSREGRPNIRRKRKLPTSLEQWQGNPISNRLVIPNLLFLFVPWSSSSSTTHHISLGSSSASLSYILKLFLRGGGTAGGEGSGGEHSFSKSSSVALDFHWPKPCPTSLLFRGPMLAVRDKVPDPVLHTQGHLMISHQYMVNKDLKENWFPPPHFRGKKKEGVLGATLIRESYREQVSLKFPGILKVLGWVGLCSKYSQMPPFWKKKNHFHCEIWGFPEISRKPQEKHAVFHLNQQYIQGARAKVNNKTHTTNRKYQQLAQT